MSKRQLTMKELDLIFEIFNPHRWPVSRKQKEIDLSFSAYNKLRVMRDDLKQKQDERAVAKYEKWVKKIIDQKA